MARLPTAVAHYQARYVHRFKITEGQSLRFRTDFFNLFNHPSFANPSAAVVGPAGGSAPITSVIGTPRLIQFSLKYSF